MIASGEDLLVKIVDFGLAKLPAGRFKIDEQLPRHLPRGTVPGTVAYMAPGAGAGDGGGRPPLGPLRARGAPLRDARRRHPFDAVEPSALFKQHVKQPPPPFAERAPGVAVPPEARGVGKEAPLEKDAAARYQSAEGELREALCEAVPEAGDRGPSPLTGARRAGPSAGLPGAPRRGAIVAIHRGGSDRDRDAQRRLAPARSSSAQRRGRQRAGARPPAWRGVILHAPPGGGDPRRSGGSLDARRP